VRGEQQKHDQLLYDLINLRVTVNTHAITTVRFGFPHAFTFRNDDVTTGRRIQLPLNENRLMALTVNHHGKSLHARACSVRLFLNRAGSRFSVGHH
jgi:hypothetical protein